MIRLTLIGAAVLFATSCYAEANELESVAAEICEAVKQVADQEGVDTITVGEFTGTTAFGSPPQSGFRLLLERAFRKSGMTVKQIGGKWAVKGKFIVTESPAPAGEVRKPVVARIAVSLVDDQDHELVSISSRRISPDDKNGSAVVKSGTVERELRDANVIALALGTNADLEPSRRQRGKTEGEILLATMRNPNVKILGGSKVAPSEASSYSLEVLVDGRPRPLKLIDNHPFVELRDGDAFELRFLNLANHTVSVEFYLDGINSFALSEVTTDEGTDAPKYRRWIVQKRSYFTLSGWHKTNAQVERFLVTDFKSSVAGKLGSTSHHGTIGAIVRATWTTAEGPPSDEPRPPVLASPSVTPSFARAAPTAAPAPAPAPAPAAAPEAPAAAPNSPGTPKGAPRLGIGQGEKIERKVAEDREKREYGVMRAAITIRYLKSTDARP